MASEPETGAPERARVPAASKKTRRKKEIKLTPREKGLTGEGRVPTNWRHLFLQALADTSSVAAAAERAGTVPLRAYKVRRRDPEFAAKWREALNEGYENLEMDALGYLRDPRPERKFDIVAALRMIAARAAKMARAQEQVEDHDEQSVLDTIDAMIEQMRERRAANASGIGEMPGDDHGTV